MSQPTPVKNLFLYIREDNAQGVRRLIEQGIDVNARDEDPDTGLNDTALIKAADYGSLLSLNILIKHGANLNARDKWDRTALVRAVESNQVECLEALLRNGADPWAPEGIKLGCSALFRAAQLGHAQCIEVLARYGVNVLEDRSETPVLVEAARFGNDEVVKQLLAMKVDVNATDTHGCTALMRAAMYNRSKCVAELLNHNANTEIENKEGETAIHLAKSNRIISVLLNRGARGGLPDKEGNTLLWKAVKGTGANFNYELVDILLGLGVDPVADPKARAIYRRAQKIISDGGANAAKLTPGQVRRGLEAAHTLVQYLKPMIDSQETRKKLTSIARTARKAVKPGRPAM